MGRKKKGYLQNSAQQVAVERLRSLGANRDWTRRDAREQKGEKGFPVCKRWKRKKKTHARSHPTTSPKYIQNESKSPMCESVSVDDVKELPANFLTH